MTGLTKIEQMHDRAKPASKTMVYRLEIPNQLKIRNRDEFQKLCMARIVV
jgi:hypothetical protein